VSGWLEATYSSTRIHTTFRSQCNIPRQKRLSDRTCSVGNATQ